MSNLLEEKISEFQEKLERDRLISSQILSNWLEETLQDYTKQVISEALPKDRPLERRSNGERPDQFEDGRVIGFGQCRSEFLKNLAEQGIIIE